MNFSAWSIRNPSIVIMVFALLMIAGLLSFKFSAVPAGILIYHNTLISEQTAGGPYSNAHWRNNLFLSRDGSNRGVMTWGNSTSDYFTIEGRPPIAKESEPLTDYRVVSPRYFQSIGIPL